MDILPGRIQLRWPRRNSILFVTPGRQSLKLDLCSPTTTTSSEFTKNHKSARRSLYNIMTALWLLPADNHDTQVMLNYTHASHTYEPYYSHQTCKTKLCLELHSTGLCDRVRNTRRYAHDGPDHAEFSDLTDLIDHHEPDSDLCFTVNPDGGYRPVGVGCVMTSSILIDKKHSLNDPHMQLISSTVHIADLMNNNRSHMSSPHIKYASDLKPKPIADALIPLLGSIVGALHAN